MSTDNTKNSRSRKHQTQGPATPDENDSMSSKVVDPDETSAEQTTDCEVIDIPVHQLTLFEPDTVYDFNFENNQSILDIELFDEKKTYLEYKINTYQNDYIR
jgi:hypothetical protein